MGKQMRFMARGLFGLILLTLTLGLLALAGNMLVQSAQEKMAGKHRPREARERVFTVDVKPLELQDYAPSITTFGEVVSGTTLELRAAASGALVQLSPNFREGGRVQKGELLFQTDPSNARSKMLLAKTELAEAKTDLEDARRDLALSREEVQAATAQLDLRKQALARQKSLRDRGLGTDAAMEAAALAASSAQQAVLARHLSVSKAQSRIARAETTIERRRIAYDEASRILAATEVHAEFDGVLSGVSAVMGRLVNANEKLGDLIDPDALEVSLRVSNAEFSALSQPGATLRGAKVSVGFTGLDRVLSGRIERVSAAVGAGKTGRELFARLDPGAASALRPGDFVTVKVREPVLRQVALIPAKAASANGEVLLVGPDNKLEAATVTILRKQGEMLVVRADGLAGRKLVLSRAPQLGAGIRVEIRGEPAESDTIEVSDSLRQQLIAFVQTDKQIPKDRKQDLLQKLNRPRPPRAIIERLSARMGS